MATETLPIRKNRFIALIVGLLCLLLIFFFPWHSSRLPNSTDVPELYGLFHLVSEQQQYLPIADTTLDPTEPIDLSVYASESPNLEWAKERRKIDKEHPLIVFSKSYCPYSRRAKQLIETYNFQPPPLIIEVDLREDGHAIKDILTRLTMHSTFPNILLKGKTLGGSDDLELLHRTRKFERLTREAGLRRVSKN